jgi:hypothetical protein
MERKLKAYVDKVEAKYEDFSVMDALSNCKKEMMVAFNEGERSRSNSPQGGKSRGAGRASDRGDSSDDGGQANLMRS